MADQYMALVEDANSKYELPDGLLPAVYQAETGGARNRATAVSPKDAVGPMQIKQAAAEDLGINRYDPAENIDGGARYLKKHLDEYGGDVTLALMAYNWGPGHTQRWIQGDPENGIKPRDPNLVPEETRKYVSKITQTMGGAPGATPTSPDPLAARVVAPELVDRFVNYQGVRIPVQSTADVSQQDLDARFAARPAPADVIEKHAIMQGKRYNHTSGQVENYGNVDKFLIGAGKTTSDFVGGAAQLYNMAVGNAQALKDSQLQTDAERKLYGHLDDAGVGMEDVGQVLAYAPLLFGPTGIIGIAGRAGLRSAAAAGAGALGRRVAASTATGAAAGLVEGVARTTADESHAKNAAVTAALVAAPGAAGSALWAAGTKIGLHVLSRWAAGALIDTYTGGAYATLGNIGHALYKVYNSTGSAESKFAGESMDWVAKLGKDKVNAKLVEMVAVAPDAASKQAAGAALEARIADSAAEHTAREAARMADAAARLPKASPPPYAGAKPASTAPVPRVPEVQAPKPNYAEGGMTASQRSNKARSLRRTQTRVGKELDSFGEGIPASPGPDWMRK